MGAVLPESTAVTPSHVIRRLIISLGQGVNLVMLKHMTDMLFHMIAILLSYTMGVPATRDNFSVFTHVPFRRKRAGQVTMPVLCLKQLQTTHILNI